MKEAAADLEFETAARLRDEIKRLRETELAIADDPLARQSQVEDRAGRFEGKRKYGKKANLLAEGKACSATAPAYPKRGEADDAAPPFATPRQGESLPRTGSGVGTEQDEHPGEGGRGSRIEREYQPVQPTYAQTTAVPSTRVRRPSLDEMGPGTDLPIPARAPAVDPRTKAGAFGETIRGPHKPTLDEMGPHAERGLPVERKRPVKTIEVEDEAEKKRRRGRPKKTGRPGQ